VVWIVAQRAAMLVAAGLAAGSVLAFALSRLLGGVILGVPASIPIVVAMACAVMVITSSVAAFLPAWRAASVDPTRALKEFRW
jgi:ABC-type antimicrobial peptide transport system permease subunit